MMKRILSLALALLLLLCGCADTTNEIFITQVDKKQLVTDRLPEQNAMVSLASESLKEFLEDYRLGKGLLVAGQGDIALYQDVCFSWKAKTDNNDYTLVYTTRTDFSDAIYVDTKETSVSVPGLLVGTQYYWQVVTHTKDGDNYSSVYSFTTEQSPRVIQIPGVSNTRDIGGYLTEDGSKKVAQGMIYRGASLGNISTEGRRRLREIYKIKTDLDLRWSTDSGYPWGGCSPLGEEVQYLHVPGVIYSENHFVGERLADELAVFAEQENYPIYMHCSAGRDRTGTLSFLIGALLGVSEYDLCIDYELTALSAKSYEKGDSSGFNKFNVFLTKLKQCEGETLQKQAENYCKNQGVTDAQIQAIREIMLEDV
jgi:protein-tyrosine phosphatase